MQAGKPKLKVLTSATGGNCGNHSGWGCPLYLWESVRPPLWRCQSKQRPSPFRQQCFLEVSELVVYPAHGHVSETISRPAVSRSEPDTSKEARDQKKQQLERRAASFRQMTRWGCNAQLQKSKELEWESSQTLREQRFSVSMQHGCVNRAKESCLDAPPYTYNDGYK